MKITELIIRLQAELKASGDVPVILASDTEGNSYGITDRIHSFTSVFDKSNRVIGVVLFPYREHIDNPEDACNYDQKS